MLCCNFALNVFYQWALKDIIRHYRITYNGESFGTHTDRQQRRNLYNRLEQQQIRMDQQQPRG